MAEIRILELNQYEKIEIFKSTAESGAAEFCAEIESKIKRVGE
jgi:hypothetical protein